MFSKEIIKCESISEYITKITEIRNRHASKNVVYRGEIADYGKTKCCPNVFRKEGYKLNKYYEKNILDELEANNIAKNDNYLFKAINAQHGGFPSRLLDISFNALIALNFAVNPHYKESTPEKIEEYNKKDGYIYIFYFDEMYCATSSIIQDCYNSVINKSNELLTNPYIFSQNYKLIDHIKLNSRVIAQQGGFILFPGVEFHSIPEWMYDTIVIPKEYKSQIIKDLKNVFGIDNSSMYPEGTNQVELISDRSVFINNSEFSEAHEFSSFLSFLNNECNYFYDKNFRFNNFNVDQLIEKYREFEKQLLLYKNNLEEYFDKLKNQNIRTLCENLTLNKLNEIIEDSNTIIISNFQKNMEKEINNMRNEFQTVISKFTNKISKYFINKYNTKISFITF